MYSDNGGGVDCILAVFLDGQSISISHTLTRGGGVVCTLVHPSAILGQSEYLGSYVLVWNNTYSSLRIF